MEWLKLTGLCILAAAMVMLLRQMHPQTASVLSVVLGLMVVAAVLPGIAEYVSQIQGFLSSAELEGTYAKVMIKTMGILLITQLACEICREMDAPSIARRVEFVGRMALLGIAVPVFVSLAEMAVSVLK